MKIGLTGGMGCGKSTVLRMMQNAGLAAVSSDRIVHDLYENDLGLRAELSGYFGDQVLTDDGKIDRRSLGSMVFKDSEKLRFLESVIHPRVRDVWMSELARHKGDITIEIPLLFENSLEDYFDRVVAVTCRSSVQFQRLRARGLTDSQIRERMSRQLALSEKVRRSHITIVNDGSLSHLEEQIAHVCTRLM